MIQLETKPAVLHATIQVIRAGTGKVDTYEIVGTPAPQEAVAGPHAELEVLPPQKES